MRQIKFIIISYHRTGSTYLALKLNSLQNVICHSEIFNKGLESFVNSIFNDSILPKRNIIDQLFKVSAEEKLFKLKNKDPEEFLDLVFSQKADAIGFKIFKNQDDATLDRLIRDKDIHKIILTRSNLFRSYVSFCIAKETGVWSSDNKEEISLTKVVINVESFLEYYEKINHFTSSVENKLIESGQRYLNLMFEEIISDFPLGKIETFLGIKTILGDTAVKQVRQNPFFLKDIVINYSEVSQILDDHNLSHFLAE